MQRRVDRRAKVLHPRRGDSIAAAPQCPRPIDLIPIEHVAEQRLGAGNVATAVLDDRRALFRRRICFDQDQIAHLVFGVDVEMSQAADCQGVE